MFVVSTSQKAGYHHGNLRVALLAAANELLNEGGVPAVTLREAARRAGVSSNAPYRHFADKEALIATVATEGFRELDEALGQASLLAERPLRALGEAYVRFALARPARFRLMFGQGTTEIARYPDLLAASRAALHRLETLVAQGEGDPMSAVRAWAFVHGLANLLIDRMIPDIDQEALLSAMFTEPA